MALKVIGAGFGRTGTLSLKAALEQIGFGPCYHMVECFPRGDTHFKLWAEARKGNAAWDAIFQGFNATVDFPAATSWRELAEYYPDAKVILSVRDAEGWWKSTQDTILSPHWVEWTRNSIAGEFFNATIYDYFDGDVNTHDHMIHCFEQHIADVQANIPEDRLLTFEARQGWEPLCDFLGVPVPEGDFPRINDTEATKEIIAGIMDQGFAGVFGWDES